MIFILQQCFAGNHCNNEYNDKKEETSDDYSISLYIENGTPTTSRDYSISIYRIDDNMH